ncbi:HTH-type transcriptional regulator MgrA [Baekduia alba]|uniref:MarR family winged helix-turn-helix transcriptional regulator n=1 Tax=Baekduia alba TaxID=2997333 RepID=UPI002341A684|nr:MarR family transcriptional regulator [Baekduia alba]WCB91536.1 HTH-type transcriptional regulator MgrA [Baekduia alba]
MDVYTRQSKAVRAAMDAALREHGLHLGQNLVLAALWEKDGQTPGAIAAAVNVTTATIAKMANRMTGAGLLTRRREDRDQRLVRLYLTDAGRELRGPVEQAMRRLEQQITAGLSASERKALMRALDRMGDNALVLVDEPGAEAG